MFGKSQKVLGLYARNNDLRTEVEKLKEELAGRDEKVARQKDEPLQKTKEDLMSDVVDSYMTSFENVVAQATCILLKMDEASSLPSLCVCLMKKIASLL